MTHDDELETLYDARQVTITQIAMIKDLQEAVNFLHRKQLLKNDVTLTAADTCTALIIDLVSVMVAIEARINCIKAHCHPLGDFISG